MDTTISLENQAVRGQTPREVFQREEHCQLPREGDRTVCVEPTPCWEEGPRTLGCRSLSSQHSAIGNRELTYLLLPEPAI